MIPAASCHFFSSIKHLIPKVSEALQSSWGASFFYHVFLFQVVQTPKGRRSSGFCWQPSFSPVMFVHLEITECFSEATIELFVATGTKALKRSTICGKNKSPIFLVKFHYICRTNSLPLLYQPVPHLACSYLFLHQRSK